MLNITLILHNLRSRHNVGAIFRTAAAAGVAKIYLTGYTPAPVDRFGRADKALAKVALGAEKMVVWEKGENITVLISKLKELNFKIVALEQAENSVDYREIQMPAVEAPPTLGVGLAIILGSEIGGVPAEVLKQCDLIAEIPLPGAKESLNVAVATGIFLFSLR